MMGGPFSPLLISLKYDFQRLGSGMIDPNWQNHLIWTSKKLLA